MWQSQRRGTTKSSWPPVSSWWASTSSSSSSSSPSPSPGAERDAAKRRSRRRKMKWKDFRILMNIQYICTYFLELLWYVWGVWGLGGPWTVGSQQFGSNVSTLWALALKTTFSNWIAISFARWRLVLKMREIINSTQIIDNKNWIQQTPPCFAVLPRIGWAHNHLPPPCLC